MQIYCSIWSKKFSLKNVCLREMCVRKIPKFLTFVVEISLPSELWHMETEALPQCLMVETEETKNKIADWRKITTGRGSNELNIILYRKLGIYLGS